MSGENNEKTLKFIVYFLRVLLFKKDETDGSYLDSALNLEFSFRNFTSTIWVPEKKLLFMVVPLFEKLKS
jgi:hypothetical protein